MFGTKLPSYPKQSDKNNQAISFPKFEPLAPLILLPEESPEKHSKRKHIVGKKTKTSTVTTKASPTSIKVPITATPGSDSKKPRHYEYMKLDQVLQLYPLDERKYVSIYGIIVSFCNGIMTIMDETVNDFRFYLNLNVTYNYQFYINESKDTDNDQESECDIISKRLSFQIGDMIRVHRLILNTDMTRRNLSVRNIVIFKSFQDDQFKPYSVAKSVTYEPYDRIRVRELVNLNIDKLKMFKTLGKSLSNSTELLQGTFQVLDVIHLDKHSVICCWSPSMFKQKENEQFQCQPVSIKLNQLVETMKKHQASHPLTDDFIGKLYHSKMLLFLIVFGFEHLSIVRQMKCWDTIVVYNMVRRPDRFFHSMFSYLIFEGRRYNQCLRIVHYDSLIAQTLREQINNYVDNPPENLSTFPNDNNQSMMVNCKAKMPSTSKIAKLNTKICELSERIPPSIFIDRHANDDDDHHHHYDKRHKKRLTTTIEIADESPSLQPTTKFDSSEYYSIENPSEVISSPIDNTDLIVSNDPFEPLDPLDAHYNEQELKLINEYLHNIENVESRELSAMGLIKQVQILPIDSRIRIQGRLFTYYSQTKFGDRFFETMKTLKSYAVIVKCKECTYWKTFDSHRTRIQKKNTQPEQWFKCPQCRRRRSCIACLDISLIIEDQEDNRLVCRWTDQFANEFFHVKAEDLMLANEANESILFNIKTLIKFLWNISRQIEQPSINQKQKKIIWTLAVCQIDPSSNNFNDKEREYRIVQVDFA